MSTSETVGPSTADMIHELVGDQKNTHKTRSLAEPELDRLQMSWEADVEDAYPVILPANFFFTKEFPNPHERVYITSLAETETAVAAIQTTLGLWSCMRSIAVEYDQKTRLLVVLRATERYFDQAISIHPDVENEQALTETSMSGNHAASELPRGLMLRVVVARIKNTKTIGLVVLINHAIFDAISINAWGTDLECLIRGGSIPERTPHKAFAEMYYLHQTSLAAKLAIDYHVRRLRGIGSMRHAIWPPSQLFHKVSARAGYQIMKAELRLSREGGTTTRKSLGADGAPILRRLGENHRPLPLLQSRASTLSLHEALRQSLLYCWQAGSGLLRMTQLPDYLRIQ